MYLKKFILISIVLSCLAFSFKNCKSKDNKNYPEIDKDTLVLSFVTVGCNREDKEDINPSDPSTANVEQLRKTYEEAATLNPKPDYFFFTGDMVFGYAKDDTAKLDAELLAWRKIYETSPLSKTGTKLIAIPGNHEILYNKKTGRGSAPAEMAWVRTMAPYIAGDNGPKPGGLYSVNSDESRLTYSFDFKGNHFIILNTDEVGLETEVNNDWIEKDISNAKASGAKNIFVFSHIPAYAPSGMKKAGEQIGHPEKFWKLLNNNNVTAMFSAHVHVYDRSQPVPGKTWMVITGNGGSPLDDKAGADRQFYGYTWVKVYKSGRIILENMGRDIPKAGYLAPVGNIKTTLRDSVEISLN